MSFYTIWVGSYFFSADTRILHSFDKSVMHVLQKLRNAYMRCNIYLNARGASVVLVRQLCVLLVGELSKRRLVHMKNIVSILFHVNFLHRWNKTTKNLGHDQSRGFWWKGGSCDLHCVLWWRLDFLLTCWWSSFMTSRNCVRFWKQYLIFLPKDL